jgi:NAD(P)-dependent dehydrogenase (short-subunit alcohol dehydrogenase family)
MRVIPLPAPLPDDPDAVRVVADEPHSYPCRRCLRDAEVGDTLLLLAYDPFLGESPYSGRGPIYVHESSCAPFAGDAIPEQLTRRLLSVRAYDERHMLVDSDVTDGAQLEAVAERLLGTTGAAYLHVHNARPGCFAARIDP